MTETLPAVCVTHLRFIPCRRPEPHHITENQVAVGLVTAYQADLLSERQTRKKLKQIGL